MLQKNIVSILIEGLQVKDELNIPSAEKALDSIKNVLVKEDVSPEAQIAIIEQLLNSADNIAFDKNTSTYTGSFNLKKQSWNNFSPFNRYSICCYRQPFTEKGSCCENGGHLPPVCQR